MPSSPRTSSTPGRTRSINFLRSGAGPGKTAAGGHFRRPAGLTAMPSYRREISQEGLNSSSPTSTNVHISAVSGVGGVERPSAGQDRQLLDFLKLASGVESLLIATKSDRPVQQSAAQRS